MKRELTCIICPRGCALTVETDENGAATVSGNACPNGKKYGIDECTHPVRTVTSVIRVANRTNTVVSVKTEKPVPKEKIFEVMKRIRREKALAPIRIGDIMIEDLCGTRIIATKNID